MFKKNQLFRTIPIIAGLAFLLLTGFRSSFNAGNHFEVVKNLELFVTIVKELNSFYVDKLDPQKLINTGIDSMLGSLDPYTNFISEEDMGSYKMQTTGKYGGIGALIRQSGDYVIIAEPYENFPAYKAGLMAGDKILEIAGKSAKGLTTDDVSKKLKGKPNTSINIKIERLGQSTPINKSLKREEIRLQSVPFANMLNKEVGYIRLTSFTEKCSKEVAKALKRLEKENKAKAIILDLRGNPGGLLSEAVNVANVFVKEGQKIVSTKGKDIKNKEYKTSKTPINTEIPLVVLINRGSASASEIVSGVVQDLDRGVVIGKRSFGKGLVQTTKDVGYSSKIKLTTAKYYLPSGRCIQAIDYSGGYSDKLEKIPDSLRTVFKTTSGRKVYDAGGIDPDIEVTNKKYGNITGSLISKQLIFDYATKYRSQHPNIATPDKFELTNQDFSQFKQFLSGKEYDYTTQSEELVKKLRKSVEEDKYLGAVEADIKQLEQQIKHDKESDLEKFKPEIDNLLEQEVVSRYFYQKGRIEEMLEEDEAIKQALDLFSDINNKYKKQLRP